MKSSAALMRQLRARAHGLNPVLMVGHKGVSETLLTELEVVLNHHELVKVKIMAPDRQVRARILETLCEHSGALCVGLIGQVGILYRAKPGTPK